VKKNLFDEYFSFSTSERRAIFILSAFILVGITTSFIIQRLPGKSAKFSEEQLKEIDELAALLSEKPKLEYKYEKAEKTRELFSFDPNSASNNEFERLGLNNRQINTINNYLNSGGKFYQKQDFKKIYTISEEEYLVLEPYIEIEKSIQLPEVSKESNADNNLESISEPISLPIVELNSAKQYHLTQLKGIGDVYASRILKYRDLLGGFYKTDQLLEVYGLNDSILQLINPQLDIDSTKINSIDINSATYKDFVRHPYIDSYLTKAIINYRDFKKSEITKQDLLKDKVIPKDAFQRVSPYIKP
jgi:DNA uptake protein ComE-like DNA-binding protein